MLRSFPIDFIRATFEQKLLEQHIANPNFFGGKDQVNILSFYEQLASQDDVNRFVETYRDLADQQNRTGLILNGVLVSPENPSITNLYSSLIVPMTFTCSLRTMLSNRDQGIITINNLIDKLKGRKVDIAQLNCVDENGNRYSEPFVVGTAGQNDGKPIIKDGDFIGDVDGVPTVNNPLNRLYEKGIDFIKNNNVWFYAERQNKLKVVYGTKSINSVAFDSWFVLDVSGKKITSKLVLDGIFSPQYFGDVEIEFIIVDNDSSRSQYITLSGTIVDSGIEEYNTYLIVESVAQSNIEDYVEQYVETEIEEPTVNIISYSWSFIEDDGTHKDILFPPAHDNFEKYKVSFSFDAIRCDEPRNLNGEEYCELSFGGSATLVNNGIKLGNDLLKIKVSKYKIPASPSDITFTTNDTYLEPLELPSGNNINTNPNQLVSNLFKTNSHADAIALTLQYTFMCDENIPLLEQWYNYARYGTLGTSQNQVSPNLIYKVNEYWCSWANFQNKEILTKIAGNLDIENTESDTLTISVSMAIQGENN